jgi:hypothetical protein
MRTTDDGWIHRKTWRRLLELHASGRISGGEFRRLKALAARRSSPPTEAAPRPRLALLQGGGGSRSAAHRFPSDVREVA